MPTDAVVAEKLSELQSPLEQNLERQWQLQAVTAGAAAASDRQLQATEEALRNQSARLGELSQQLAAPLKAIAAREQAEAEAIKAKAALEKEQADARRKRWDKLMRPVILVPLLGLLVLTGLVFAGKVTLAAFKVEAPGLSVEGTSP